MRILKKISILMALTLLIALAFFSRTVWTYTGNYSITSPFSCGANCLGPYELFGHDTEYCKLYVEECFNTIDGCKDGAQEYYEFVDDITITSLNNTMFLAGDTILIDALVDCDTDGNIVSLAYHNGSGFRNIYNAECNVDEKVHIYYNQTLDYFMGNHTVRAIIGFPGQIGVTCGEQTSNPSWTDTDDVTFYVEIEDITPPSVSEPTPEMHSIFEIQEYLEIMICIHAVDDYGVESVYMNVTWGEGQEEIVPLFEAEGNYYCDGFSADMEPSDYFVKFTVADFSGNINNTAFTNFTVMHITNITVQDPTARKVLPFGPFSLNFTLPEGYEAEEINYSLDGLENISINASRVNVSFEIPDSQEERGEANIEFSNLSMSFIPSINMSVNMVSISLKKNGSVSPEAEFYLINDSSDSPSEEPLTYGTISDGNVTGNYSWVDIILENTVNLTAGDKYWLMLYPNGSSSDHYTWQSSDDGLYSNGNYSNNRSLDLLFIVYDARRFKTTMSGVQKGEHNIVIYANDGSRETISSPTVWFTIDDSAPEMLSKVYNPNTTAGLDPGTTINFSMNITDETQIESVILQHRQINGSEFSNSTATLTNGLYYANFTPDQENTWLARIIATDTSGNTYVSGNDTLSVFYERNWSWEPSSFNTTSALIDTNRSIGNITLTSMADFALSFNLSKTESSIPLIYFNSSPGPFTVILNPSSSLQIPVKATGQVIESEHEVSLLIDPLNGSAQPDYALIDFVFITYVSGPHLNIRITDYDTSVTQGQARITFTAIITNVGNETANDIFASWILPDGWATKTNLTATYSSLSIGQQVSFSRELSIGTNASLGNQTVYAMVNCSEGKNDSDQRLVYVSSSAPDQETIIINRGGGGGGGTSQVARKSELEITLPDEIELERGKSTTLRASLRNTGNNELNNITLIIQGYPLAHYKIIPSSINNIGLNQTIDLEILINAPEYSGSEKYPAILIAESKEEERKETFSKKMSIIVYTEDKSLAAICFEQARAAIGKLESFGMNTEKSKERLAEAEESYADKEYSIALNACNKIIEDIKKAESTREQLSTLRTKYSELGKDSSEIEELLRLSEEALRREDYALAERRAQEANFVLGLEEREVEQSMPYKISLVKAHIKEILLFAIMLAIIATFAYSSRSMYLLKKQLEQLDKREKVIRESVNDIQGQYFVKKTMPTRLYKKGMEQCRESLAEIEKKRMWINLKRLKITSNNSAKDLQKIRKEAEEAKNDLQKKYYVKKTIDRESFRKFDANIDSMLINIDGRIKMKEKKKNKGKEGLQGPAG